jgi:serine O-acetyltransferase
MRPERLWWWSHVLHRRGLRPLAAVLKTVNFVVFHTVLPPECAVSPDVTLYHRGLGTVVHPNTRIGRRVSIGHGVTIAAGSQEPGSPLAVHVGDDVVISAGCFIRPRRGRALTIGAGARLAAHSIVVDDVPAGARVVPPVATVIPPATDAGHPRRSPASGISTPQ